MDRSRYKIKRVKVLDVSYVIKLYFYLPVATQVTSYYSISLQKHNENYVLFQEHYF